MAKGIKITGVYKGQDNSIMVAGVVFRKGCVSESVVDEDLFVKLKDETDKGGWFEIKSHNLEEYMKEKGITTFRGVEIKFGKEAEPKEDVVEPIDEPNDEPNEGTEKVDEGTEKVNEGTEKVDEGTEKVNEGTEKVDEEKPKASKKKATAKKKEEVAE